MLPIQLLLELGEDGKNFSNNSIKEETLQGFFASSNSAVGKRINYSREEQTLQGFIANSNKNSLEKNELIITSSGVSVQLQLATKCQKW